MKKSLPCSALKGASQHLNKVIMENSCVFPYLLPFLVGIGLDHNLHIFCNNLHFKRLQTVRSVASSGKFYRLPPDKENTANPQNFCWRPFKNWIQRVHFLLAPLKKSSEVSKFCHLLWRKNQNPLFENPSSLRGGGASFIRWPRQNYDGLMILPKWTHTNFWLFYFQEVNFFKKLSLSLSPSLF